MTSENHWQIASLVTQKSLFTVTDVSYYQPVNIYPNNWKYISKSFARVKNGHSFTVCCVSFSYSDTHRYKTSVSPCLILLNVDYLKHLWQKGSLCKMEFEGNDVAYPTKSVSALHIYHCLFVYGKMRRLIWNNNQRYFAWFNADCIKNTQNFANNIINAFSINDFCTLICISLKLVSEGPVFC